MKLLVTIPISCDPSRSKVGMSTAYDNGRGRRIEVREEDGLTEDGWRRLYQWSGTAKRGPRHAEDSRGR
jgi:hypothetical protein